MNTDIIVQGEKKAHIISSVGPRKLPHRAVSEYVVMPGIVKEA